MYDVPILAVAMPCFSTEASRLDSMHKNSAGTMHPVTVGMGLLSQWWREAVSL
jgi:hypothetical protein